MTSRIAYTAGGVPTHHWVVRRSSRDCWNPIAFEPLAIFPASPPSNVWQAQNAMVTLQRRGIACYMDMITIHEEIPA